MKWLLLLWECRAGVGEKDRELRACVRVRVRAFLQQKFKLMVMQ